MSVLDREMLTYILESAVSDDLKVVENRGISETLSERICTTGFLVNVPQSERCCEERFSRVVSNRKTTHIKCLFLLVISASERLTHFFFLAGR